MDVTGPDDKAPVAVEHVVRAEFGRIVAGLARRFGDLDLAEDMAQEAVAEALQRWPVDGVPRNPAAWLTLTARNRAIDRLRREASRQRRHEEAYAMLPQPEGDPSEDVLASQLADDRLQLIFTCCHPALAPESQVALTLRLLGGLTVAEIAAAFLVEERALAQRITRAKKKIAAARIPYRVPDDHDLPERLDSVLTVLWLIFNEGYLPQVDDVERADLVDEAVRLTRVLVALMPDEPEVWGLLATMLLTRARAAARLNEGRLVPLPEQDRSRWDAALVAEGHQWVRRCLQANRPGPHQFLAAINAVHTDAATAAETDWDQIVALYDQWLAMAPTPVVELNRAVALAERDGPEAGLAVVDRLDLANYHAWHVARAELLHRLGRRSDAVQEFRAALELASLPSERAHLVQRLADLTAP